MRPKLARWIIAGVLLAVACLGLRFRWMWLVHSIVAVTVAVYLVGMVRAILIEGRGRVTALAFTMVGASYLMLVSGQLIRDTLPTQHLLAVLWQGAWKGQIFLPVGTDEMVELTNYDPGTIEDVFDLFRSAFDRRHTAERKAAYAYVVVAQCVLSWFFAAVAGWIAGRVYDRRRRAAARAQLTVGGVS
jgi:hypothetical protein